MNNTLLPTGSTPLENAASSAMAEFMALPVPLRDLWNPDRCPVNMLPYLAWALSVDRWDENWPEQVKRHAIRSAFFVHKRKGTVGALRRVVEPLGYLFDVTEWWQSEPVGPRGTFSIKVGVKNLPLTDELRNEIEHLIDDAKPLSRHLVGLAVSMESHGRIYAGTAAYLGDEITVYPYTPSEIVVTGISALGGGNHIIDTMSIYP